MPRWSSWSPSTIATIKYSTVQNWYPGDADGKGGIYNFVTKRGRAGHRAKISWTQVETGSAITWKYPSVILQGDDSVGEFYSVAVTTNHQQADTGTKMIHIGRNTSQHHPVQGHLGRARAEHLPGPGEGAPLGDRRPQPHPVRLAADRARVRRPHVPLRRGEERHRRRSSTRRRPRRSATTSSSTAASAGLTEEDATSMIVNGFCREVFDELPMEYAVEAQALMRLSLEGAVG